uniref:Uncharacterized protein n=1 Tax=Glossina pallidipes TaxID=7398 RepID=A0A1B0A2V5_GLOPL
MKILRKYDMYVDMYLLHNLNKHSLLVLQMYFRSLLTERTQFYSVGCKTMFDAFLCHMPAICYKRNCKTIVSVSLVSFAVDEYENVLPFAAEVVFCLNTLSELDNSKMCELASNLFDGVIVLY